MNRDVPQHSLPTSSSIESRLVAAKSQRDRPGGLRLSLRELMGAVLLVAMLAGFAVTQVKLSRAEAELDRLRKEVGYLQPTDDDQIAATRVVSNVPLTYRFRVRVPKQEGVPRQAHYRVAYSSVIPKGKGTPEWFASVPVPPGESTIILRVAEDARDQRWKLSALVRNQKATQRVATGLILEHVEVFCGSHQRINTGIDSKTATSAIDGSIRLLDERWLVGEGSTMLYGDRPVDADQIGVYAELQPVK